MEEEDNRKAYEGVKKALDELRMKNASLQRGLDVPRSSTKASRRAETEAANSLRNQKVLEATYMHLLTEAAQAGDRNAEAKKQAALQGGASKGK